MSVPLDAPLPASRLILGTAHLTDNIPVQPRSLRRGAAFALLDRALELGIHAVDTAATYQLGGSERVVGEWMARRTIRDRVYLISKGGHPRVPLGRRPRLRRGELARSLDRSLDRLRTDYLDLYLLHRDDPSQPIEPVAEALWSFVDDGRIRAYGVSNWTHQRYEELYALAVREGMPPPVASSPQFSLPVWSTPDPPFPGCISVSGSVGSAALRCYRASGTGVLAWSPLGSGWLRPAGHRARHPAYRGRANDERLDRAAALAREAGCTMAQLATAYVLSHGPNLYAIVGTGRPERLAELPKALNLPLAPHQLEYLAGGATQCRT